MAYPFSFLLNAFSDFIHVQYMQHCMFFVKRFQEGR